MSRKLQARGHGALSEPPSWALRLGAAVLDTLLVVGFLALYLALTQTPPLPDPEGAGWFLLICGACWLLLVHWTGATIGQRLLGLGRTSDEQSSGPGLLQKLANPVLQIEKLSPSRKIQVTLLGIALASIAFAGADRTLLNHPLWMLAKITENPQSEPLESRRLLGEEPQQSLAGSLTWPKQNVTLNRISPRQAVLKPDAQKAFKACLTGSFFKRVSLPCLNLRSLVFAPTVLNWERELGKSLHWELSWIDQNSGCALLRARGKGRIHSACLTLGEAGGVALASIRNPERPEILERQAHQVLLTALKNLDSN